MKIDQVELRLKSPEKGGYQFYHANFSASRILSVSFVYQALPLNFKLKDFGYGKSFVFQKKFSNKNSKTEKNDPKQFKVLKILTDKCNQFYFGFIAFNISKNKRNLNCGILIHFNNIFIFYNLNLRFLLFKESKID